MYNWFTDIYLVQNCTTASKCLCTGQLFELILVHKLAALDVLSSSSGELRTCTSEHDCHLPVIPRLSVNLTSTKSSHGRYGWLVLQKRLCINGFLNCILIAVPFGDWKQEKSSWLSWWQENVGSRHTLIWRTLVHRFQCFDDPILHFWSFLYKMKTWN